MGTNSGTEKGIDSRVVNAEASMVHQPPHYQNTTTVIVTTYDDDGNATEEELELPIQVVDVMEMFFPDNTHLGTALIYLLRIGKKSNNAQDTDKCIWWLLRHLEHEGLESEHT